MASVKPIAIVANLSGKVCQHSDMYFSTNKQTGKVYTGKRCFPSEAAPSEAQLAARTKFGQLMGQCKAWLAENKPSATQLKGTELYQQTLAAYKSQHRIGRFNAYIVKHVLKADETNPQGGNGGSTGGAGDLG